MKGQAKSEKQKSTCTCSSTNCSKCSHKNRSKTCLLDLPISPTTWSFCARPTPMKK